MSGLWERLAARPTLARTLAAHVREFEAGRLPARTRELIALMVSWLNACENCTETHREMAAALGVDAATLDDLTDFARSPHFTDAERAALSVAVALTREPRALPPPLRTELERHFAPDQVVEAIALVGLYNYINRASNALSERSSPARGCAPP